VRESEVRNGVRRATVGLALILAAAAAPLPAGAQRSTPPAPRATGAVAGSEEWYNWTDDGVRHYVLEFGRAAAPGDTVVVLHGGWGAEHSYLVDPLLPLADRYRFVLYDQRGSLRSPAPDSTLSLDRLVADLEDLRGALGMDRMTLVAHSMGTALAYAYLAAHPDRVRGLVLASAVHPAPFAGGINMDFIRRVWPQADSAALFRARQAFVDSANRRAKARVDAEGLLPDSLRAVPASEIDVFRIGEDRDRTRAWRIFFAAVNTCDGANWRQMKGGQVYYSESAARAIMRDSLYARRAGAFWPALRSYRGPVRVIGGTCDFIDLGPAVWPHVVDRLPNAELAVIPGAGHNLWMDRPEAFRDALSAALAAVTGS
jgi:proline iminopeptidase